MLSRTGAAVALLLFCLTLVAHAEPTPEQSIYWWQDELRTVCLELAKARSGKPAQWPQMSVPAGNVVMPLPPTGGPIAADGKLDEVAWKQATRFPVGPIFDDWFEGPFMLQVSVCGDEKNFYLAIESPRDLNELGALTPRGELFTIGDKPFRVGAGGGIPASAIGRLGEGHVIEVALPLTADMNLTFSVENLRRVQGKLPPGASDTGLSPQKPARPTRKKPVAAKNAKTPDAVLWLQPIAIRLLPAPAGVRVELTGDRSGRRLTSQQGETKIAAEGNPAVVPYAWKATVAGRNYTLDGFVYNEPIAETLAATRQILSRTAAAGSSRLKEAPSAAEISAMEMETRRVSEAKQTPSADNREAWRDLFCRARELRAKAHLSMLDAPLLFVKQHPYFAGHIYDDFYPWHPGGGVYILDEPHRPQAEPKVRTVIDATTNETLGEGVYRDPDLSWDATQLVFANKQAPAGVTSLYTIGIDGRGLKRLTSSEKHSDYQPAWLPDGRIVCISTRPRALVPCFNSGVGTLHVMNADGGDLHTISVNNVNEFDPSVLADGRILYGRWEYVDKTALYMQSVWTTTPDGRMEEAMFKNNIPKPTACLDARGVPGSHLVAASLTPHNGQPVGAIGMIDPRFDKNDLAAITNFTPEYPVEMDQGLTTGPCDPWPLSEDDLLMSNNAIGAHGIIELVDRFGNRELVHSDPAISCYTPMLVKPRPQPPRVSELAATSTSAGPAEAGGESRRDSAMCGRFLVADVYQGLTGVPRGTIKRLRVVEETARTSGLPPGGRWWNQAFLVSWQGAYIVKNILGTVPVHEDGSAYFTAPPGKALYFEALDAEGREIQRMRTFVQAAPGVTRSCIGCHESKKSAAPRPGAATLAMLGPPANPEPESWGSGYLDFPTMVQPVLDKHCVRCHGGPEGFGKGLDLSGGWTWAFNIGYETLIKNRLTGFLNCENGSVHTSRILPPKTIGSGAAPLAEILIKKHPEVSRKDRDLLLAWMDTNSNYYGTWDYTPYAICEAILAARGPLTAEMQTAGCTECHTAGHIGNDWINLQTPEWSRILRAPMAKEKGGLGVAMCRKRKARDGYPLVTQAVQPPDVIKPSRQPPWDDSGSSHVSFTSAGDPRYQAMLRVIRHARSEALARPRVDMPGAEVVPGECRMMVAIAVPDSPPDLEPRLRSDGAVELAWLRTAATIGLQYELHRGATATFVPSPVTQIGLTTAGRYVDLVPPVGPQHYALVVTSGAERSHPVWASVDVPQLPPPSAPTDLIARSLPGEIALVWQGAEAAGVRYDVYRGKSGEQDLAKLTAEPLLQLNYTDVAVDAGARYRYAVRAVDRRGQASPLAAPVEAAPLEEIKEPVFAVSFDGGAKAKLSDGRVVQGNLLAGAKTADGCLVLGATGYCTFEHLPEFDLSRALSLELWARIDEESQMPVLAACGGFSTHGWFLQRFGGGWRWHVAPASCDGGQPVVGRWTHLVAVFAGDKAALYQDGKPVASAECYPNRAPWSGPLVLGQYSSQGESFQVHGKLTGVKLYRRALRPAEVVEHFKSEKPPL